MKNIFIIGLQRTGTNYVERVLNDNTQGLAFRGKINDSGEVFSKHEFPYVKALVENSIIKHEGFLVVVKNPYMWSESIGFRDEGNRLNVDFYGNHTATYKLKEKTEVSFGNNGYNLINILSLFKDFYTDWCRNKDVFLVKYEDFLGEDISKKQIDNVINYFNEGQAKSNLKLPSKPVNHSPDFTLDDFNYYKKEQPELLNPSDIDTVNSVLGSEFIESLGYKIL